MAAESLQYRPPMPAPVTAAELAIAETWLDVYRRAYSAHPYLMQRVDYRRAESMQKRDDGVLGGERLALDLIALRNAGAPETTCRAMLDRLSDLLDTL